MTRPTCDVLEDGIPGISFTSSVARQISNIFCCVRIFLLHQVLPNGTL